MKKIAVIGSRSFNDVSLVNQILVPLIPFVLVSGGARGADDLGEKFADHHQLDKMIFPAEWKKYGSAAGPIRNKLIVEACDEVIAFWDGKSTGTQHSINYAKELGKPVQIIPFAKN